MNIFYMTDDKHISMDSFISVDPIIESTDDYHFIIMVGLPGRGKSYMSARICRWLRWKNLSCEIFNTGNTRRKTIDKFVDYKWFVHDGEENDIRENISEKTVDNMIEWITNKENKNLNLTHKIGIFDATNATNERRTKILEKLSKFVTLDKITFIESICDNNDILDKNYSEKLCNEDYINLEKSLAEIDFKNRVNEYQKKYKSVESDNAYIQIYNMGEKFVLNKLSHLFQKNLAHFLLNLSKRNITIYMSRHGQSVGQIQNIIGGNSNLTKNGFEYSYKLKKYFDSINKNNEKYDILCSKLQRTINTAKSFSNDINYTITQHSELNEIFGGEFESMSFDEVKEKFPDIYEFRKKNKFESSWPGGESYKTLIHRLESILLKIENETNNLIIIAHQAVCRMIYAYMMDVDPRDCVNMEINSHRLFEFNTKQNKREMKYYDL